MENNNVLALFGKVDQEGNLDLDVPPRWVKFLRAFAGRRVMITIEDEPRTPTNGQYRFVHGYIIRPIAEHLGEVPANVKADLKERWHIASLKDLNPRQMDQLIEEWRAYAATEHGITVPEPGEVVIRQAPEPELPAGQDV